MSAGIRCFAVIGLFLGLLVGFTSKSEGARRVVVTSPAAVAVRAAYPPRSVVVAPAPIPTRRALRYQRRHGYPVGVVALPPAYVVAIPVVPPPLPVTTWRSPTGFVYRYDYQSAVMPHPPVMPAPDSATPESIPAPDGGMESVPAPVPEGTR